jgi:hypothetical protein
VRLDSSDSPDDIAKKATRDPELFLVAEKDGPIVGTVAGGFMAAAG